MSQNCETLWQALKRGRREFGISQAALAAQLGVDREAIARIEAGAGSLVLAMQILEVVQHRHTDLALGSNLSEQFTRRRDNRGWSLSEAARNANIDFRTARALEGGRGTVASANRYLQALAPKATLKRVSDSLWAYDRGRLKKTDSRFTPADFVQDLVAAFGEITLDPCSHPKSPVAAKRFIAPPENGLEADWSVERHVFVNPPFSTFERWIKKANDTWDEGSNGKITMLIPTARVDLREFTTRAARHGVTLHLVNRLRFGDPDDPVGKLRAPFAMSLICWGCDDEEIEAFRVRVPSLRLEKQVIVAA